MGFIIAMNDSYYDTLSFSGTTQYLADRRSLRSRTSCRHYTANPKSSFRFSKKYTSPYAQTAFASTRKQANFTSASKQLVTVKPKTPSFPRRNTLKKTYFATIVNQNDSKLLQKENPILYYCNQFTSDSSEQLFCNNLPRLLEARFKQFIQFCRSPSRIMLPPLSIAEMMKHEGYGTVFAQRIAWLIAKRYQKFTRMKFAALLLNVLTYKDGEAALKFCFEVLSDKESLDSAEMCAWYQSEAEPLLRNDLLCICRAFKMRRITGWNSSKLIDYNRKEDEEKKLLTRHLKWDLKLWGHVCRKFDKRAIKRHRKNYDTYDKDSQLEDDYNYPQSEQISFEQFKTIKFPNKGLPDILFLAIQMIYGVTICDAYCTHLRIKLFRPFCRYANEVVLQKMHRLPYDRMKEYK
eukprot:TRINITY_DN11422_c0_g2_i2.p1 TRINITY_DN11422_c0_g2~~TRINITY_DN11422_c0_g2_i2.p1  ORF type:complete len:415 (-),score=66.69 TRINITY_DN11422_c0_g2_i2:554-1771(-)